MKIDVKRVKNDIESLKVFNASPGKGVSRLSFSQEDKDARAYIKSLMEEIGLEVWEDGYSTIFGRLEGKNPQAPVIMVGSHFDSVNQGGPFDGVAGLVTGLEIARVLKENQIQPYYPIEIVAMNDEEGVRFGRAVANSSAMVGLIKEEDLDLTKDKEGISLREAIEFLGIKPDLKAAKRSKDSIKAFLELHIEQGPILEEENKKIGLVETIVGYDMYKVIIQGQAGHAGTTPMNYRSDALLAASELALGLEGIANSIGGPTVATVGEFDLEPNASNVIPALVRMSLDIRSTDINDMNRAEEKVKALIKEIEVKRKVSIKLIKNLRANPVNLSKELISTLEDTIRERNYPYMRMNSGAGHDAMIMAQITESAMIFVPSKDGLSHHPDEWTDYDDLEKGIQIVLDCLLKIMNK